MLKKCLAIFLTLIFIFCLAGCDNEATFSNSESEPTTNGEPEQAAPSESDSSQNVGNLSGAVYTSNREAVPNLSLWLEDVGKCTTDNNGEFEFTDIPAGTYKLYAITEENDTTLLRDVTILANVSLTIKVIYTPPTTQENNPVEEDGGLSF